MVNQIHKNPTRPTPLSKMTASVKTVEILTTLEEDPHVNFFPWEMDVHDTAASMAKSLHPNGLLSAVLTDEQWAALNPIRSENKYENDEIQKQWANFLR